MSTKRPRSFVWRVNGMEVEYLEKLFNEGVITDKTPWNKVYKN